MKVKKYIRENLEVNAFYSLRDCCHRIEMECGFEITKDRLRRTFNKMNISYERVKSVMKATHEREIERLIERKEFALKLASLLKQKKPVIFADEASFGPWNKYSIVKTWVDKDNPFSHKLNTRGVANVTMYGCISSLFSDPIFMTNKGTNIVGW